ncbi:4-hydroxy-tetrahydrodipicolinate reductase [Putridiphycobacter roseus]|uniref:4-hydroxy-tetrahydrodipicolinate reductase n=1 Tax=Putridiphycobacter roseus TaxID=2219161 RepID=A0A2W1NLC9_9FLAO|nr:4-hydroxy-tetrahydrodipicolinate reductase [Putridiphycobacter roseus]PZE18646.1 4-hydroxy-tetrahydrodipicolinate reductase [Putridiphycobacter roseus]
MNIAIFGYGKMGKEIEKILIERGHKVVERITSKSDKSAINTSNIDVVIEFSSPHAAAANIQFCIDHKLPIVIGTTGWYEQLDTLKQNCNANQSAMVYGTNFSIGVNIFFTINSALAKIMNANLGYTCTVKEVHHTEKKDAPSGTGITIAEDIIAEMDTYQKWENVNKSEISGPEVLSLASERLPDVPGTHIVSYENNIDRIDLIHTAKNRTGFALGSVLAAEWIKNKQGVFSIKEIMPELIKEII